MRNCAFQPSDSQILKPRRGLVCPYGHTTDLTIRRLPLNLAFRRKTTPGKTQGNRLTHVPPQPFTQSGCDHICAAHPGLPALRTIRIRPYIFVKLPQHVDRQSERRRLRRHIGILPMPMPDCRPILTRRIKDKIPLIGFHQRHQSGLLLRRSLFRHHLSSPFPKST